jgi:RNA polymerase sigma factor (sigma-70 family)
MSEILTDARIKEVAKMVSKGCLKYRIPIDDREDILQDVYVRILEREELILRSLDRTDYINQLIDNFICNKVNQVKTRDKYHDHAELPDVEDDRSTDIIDRLALDQLRDHLTPTEQKIYDGYRAGIKPSDIGEELNLSAKNVSVSMSRIVKKLQALVAKDQS